MDVREEEHRFHEGKRLAAFASALRILALLFVIGWIGILLDRSSRTEVLDLFGALGAAAIMWALALIVVSQARVEKNTRDAVSALERIAETMKPHKHDDA